MKKTILINLLGAAGSGKSVLAAKVFAALKVKGYNCEYVPEVAKGLLYEENFKRLADQLSVFSSQYFNLHMLRDKVDILVTDSPLVLSIFYNKIHSQQEIYPEALFNDLVMYCHSTFDNMNYFIKRNHPYKTEGRFETESQATEEERLIEQIVNKNKISHRLMLSTDDCLGQILFDVEQKIKFQNRKGYEIERKFLMSDFCDLDLKDCRKYDIVQGYLEVGSEENNFHEVRVRQFGDMFFRTEKSGDALVRQESEKEISKEEFENSIKLCGERVVSKTRYFYPLGKNMAEIDVYHNVSNAVGRPLKTVEVEFDSVTEANYFDPPAWCGREITGDQGYKNVNLAVMNAREKK